MRVVHLIRHGDYGLLGRALAGRSSGHSLSAAGQAQAERVADALADRKFAAIVSGPLERARETAAPLASRLGLELVVDRGFDEIDFGAWTGLSFSALEGDSAWSAFNRFRSWVRPPAGESMTEVLARTAGALRRLCATLPEGEIAVFTHADIIKTLLAHFLCMPLDMLPRLAIDPAGRSELVIHESEVGVLGVNLPPGV